MINTSQNSKIRLSPNFALESWTAKKYAAQYRSSLHAMRDPAPREIGPARCK